MTPASHPPKRSRLSRTRGLVRSAQNVVFYVLSCVVGLAGLGLAGIGFAILGEGYLYGLLVVVLSAIPISLPIVVFRERARDKALARFLIENAASLTEGAPGPGGVTYTLDTVLVSYQTRFSVLVLSLKFDSGFYLHGPGHRLPKLLYTLFAALFGWWSYDWQVWIDNLSVIANNLSDSNQVTVAQLLGLEEPVAEEGAPLDPGRLPA